MNSRELILQKIKANKPENKEMPVIQVFKTPDFSKFPDLFKESMEKNGGIVYKVKNTDEIINHLNEIHPSVHHTCSMVTDIAWGNRAILKNQNPKDLKDMDVVLLKAQIGVSENAAMWFTEKDLGQRVLPFITQHLAVVLNSKDLVGNMHQAYEKIHLQTAGYGVFIAGPSKTADIEQSLVIGAHGSRSMTVFLVG